MIRWEAGEDVVECNSTDLRSDFEVSFWWDREWDYLEKLKEYPPLVQEAKALRRM